MPDAIPQLADRGWLIGRYCAERRTQVEIAAELGCTQAAVCKALARAGIETRPKGAPARPVVRAVGPDVETVTARVAAYAAERVLLMGPGDVLVIRRGEDGPDMFRIGQQHEYPLADAAARVPDDEKEQTR